MRTRRLLTLIVVGLSGLLLRTSLVRAEPEKNEPAASLRAWLDQPRGDRPALASQAFADVPLTRQQANTARKLLWDDHVTMVKADRDKEWNDKSITIGDHTLRFLSRQFGNKPKNGWNLYISMHGGGNAQAQVNDQQWQNQIKLYQPTDALYIAPRAPTNTWNLWHEAHIDPLFDRLIEDAVVLGDVDANHVYIMGYSAGGDGVYQLAPRMADRLAAAAMMAGHPNDASPLGLRNIGFAIHVGALDNGYDRNKVAAEWGKKLDDLAAADPKGYAHQFQLHEGRSHWMNLEDKVAVDWMAGFTRDPLPLKVVWKQSTVTHDRFYWLAVPAKSAKAGSLVVASRDGQTIDIEKAEDVPHLMVLLNDKMLDLDKPVTITCAGRELFKGKVKRTIGELAATLGQRGDRELVFDAAVEVRINSGK
jgi:hypothetical protein